MITVSLCMIVKNEEEVLARCLDSISDLIDEMIIVDTGSTDATKEIAQRYTDNIYDFVWTDDFASARNYSFSKATKEYCMWLDADDILQEKDRQLFYKLKCELNPDISVVRMKYNTAFDDNGTPIFSYYRERLIKNNNTMEWKGVIHEVVESVGTIEHCDCAISHKKETTADPDRNLRIFEKLITSGVPLEPRMQFYYGRELYYHAQYEKALSVFLEFIENGQGFLENTIDACCHSSYCYDALNLPQQALLSLFRSFSYDSPRAEVCCDIGRHFFTAGNYWLAAYWYEMALACKRDDTRGGFVSPDCYGYLPCIQLCVCFFQLNQIEKAMLYNELAGAYKPEDSAVLHNRSFFSTL